MKDENGLYYYPYLLNKNLRMYVREEAGTILFRLWSAEDPQLWKDHEWIPYDAVLQAAKYHKKERGGPPFNPRETYDIDLARELIVTNRKNKV